MSVFLRAFVSMVLVVATSSVGAGNFEAYVIHHEFIGGQQTLYRLVLDGASSTLVPVAPLERPVAGTAVSPAGALLALDGFADEVVRIDVATGGVETVIGLDLDVSPYPEYEDLAIADDGSAWLSVRDNLYSLDLDTGSTSLVGPVGGISQLVAYQGALYGAGGDRFVRIDPVTVQVNLIATYSGSYWSGGYSGLSSAGGRLWGLFRLHSYTGPEPLHIKEVTADDGHGEDIATITTYYLGWNWYEEHEVALEVVSAPGDPPGIPAVSLPGVALLVAGLAAVGFLLLRRFR